MGIRTDSAAQTRRDLVAAAEALLDQGGPAAVTLRAVGDRAGVSRGAPYGHFDGKGHLLAVMAAESWREVEVVLRELRGQGATAQSQLRQALEMIIRLGIARRAKYELMFVKPETHQELVADAAESAQGQFIAIVAEVVGQSRSRRAAALLMGGAHGIAAMSANGHLDSEKWRVGAADLLDDLIVSATRPADPDLAPTS